MTDDLRAVVEWWDSRPPQAWTQLVTHVERLRALLARPVDEPQCDGYAGDVGASAPRCESYRGHAGRHFIDHRAIVPSASSPATMCVCGHDHAHAIKYDDPDCPVVLCDCQNFRPTSSPTNERVERYEEALQEILTISADDFPAYARIDSEARNAFMDGRESAAKIAREALRIRAEELGRSQKGEV